MKSGKTVRIEDMFGSYIYKTPKQRMNILYANYRGFELIWTKLANELACSLYEQKQCNRSTGDIGVRVQTSHAASSPTENRAIGIMEIEDAIATCDFTGELLRDIDDPEDTRDKVLSLDLMKREFNELLIRLEYLPEEDRHVLLRQIFDNRSFDEIAGEQCMERDSIIKKLWRIKKSLFDNMLPVLEGTATY